MGKSSPSPPPAPDPVATASAQAQANAGTATAQTALNNINQITPYGSLTYAQTGSQSYQNPDGSTSTVPTFTSTQSLSADQQKLYNQQVKEGYQANNAASLGLNAVNQSLRNPVTADSLPGLTTDIGASPTLQSGYASGQVQTGYDPGGAIRTSYDQGPALQYGYDQGGAITRGYDPGGAIQSDVNLNADAPTSFAQTKDQVLGSLGSTDFTADRDAATNAALARLAPTIAAQQESLNASLANQGTAQGSAAYNAAQLQRNQANNDLYLGAVQTGDAEQQALFGERATAGQFQNAAQDQEYQQALGRGQFAQQGIAQNNAATLSQGQFHNAAQGQQNAENASAAAFANSAQDQANRQNAAAAGFFNSTVGQQNAQNAAQASFYNAAQGQQNAENQAAAGFYNAGIGQQAQQNAALAAFSNSAANQDYQNRLTGATFGNQAREQSLSDQETINNNIVNQISALKNGGQVTTGQYQGYTPGQIDQTPYNSDVYQSAGLQNQQYMAQLQNQAANTSAFGSVLGGLAGGIGKKSDRRLKSDVSRVARARNGLTIYRYRLAGEAPGWHLGFMADEVALLHPEAVWTGADGWARVDYERAVA